MVFSGQYNGFLKKIYFYVKKRFLEKYNGFLKKISLNGFLRKMKMSKRNTTVFIGFYQKSQTILQFSNKSNNCRITLFCIASISYVWQIDLLHDVRAGSARMIPKAIRDRQAKFFEKAHGSIFVRPRPPKPAPKPAPKACRTSTPFSKLWLDKPLPKNLIEMNAQAVQITSHIFVLQKTKHPQAFAMCPVCNTNADSSNTH